MNKVVLMLLLSLPFSVFAAETKQTGLDTDRAALRQILNDIETSINAMDFESLFKHFDENISISFMTTDVAVGKKAIMDFYDKMFKAEGAPLKSHKTKASLAAPAIFHDNTITAYGRAQDTFELNSGSTHQFNTRWVATAVKKGESWKVVAISFSVNPLKNPILDELTGNMGMYITLAFVIGVIISFLLARLTGRKKSPI